MQIASFTSVSKELSGRGYMSAGHVHGPAGGATAAAGTAPAAGTMVAGAGGGTGMAAPAEAHNPNAHNHHIEPEPPSYGDPRFLQGSVGPHLPKGEADTLKIPDGDGYLGLSGREQNDDDKDQNNYSVTDANFSNTLGLLAGDPDTGELLTYNQHTQMYNAAGYIETYAPDVYRQLVENQNAGKGTILGSAAYIFGMVQTPDPALEGVDTTQIPMTIPGTNVEARSMVLDPHDATGQDWARMHHAQASWVVFKSLMDAGLDFETATILSGDDAISGSGRLNGFNNQNGDTGFNEDESAVFRLGAKVEQRTGIPVVQLMMAGHAHTGIDESTMTDPRINKIIGFPEGAREATPERAAAIRDALLSGDALENGNESLRQAQKFDMDNDRFFSQETIAAGGIIDVVRAEDEALAAALPPEENNNDGGGGNENTPVGTEGATGPGTGPAPAATDVAADVAPAGGGAIGADLAQMFPAAALPGTVAPPVGLENALDPDGRILKGGALDFSADVTDDMVQTEWRKIMDSLIERMIFVTASETPDADGKTGEKKPPLTIDGIAIDSAGSLDAAIGAAMEDGTISEAEADSLLGAARVSTRELLQAAMDDGTIDEQELAAILGKASEEDEAAAEKGRNRGRGELDELIDSAMEDGTISAEERAAIFDAADAGEKVVLEKALADGELSVEERDSMLQSADDTRRAADKVSKQAMEKAMEDGNISAEERAELDAVLNDEQRAELDGMIGEDGTVDAAKAGEMIGKMNTDDPGEPAGDAAAEGAEPAAKADGEAGAADAKVAAKDGAAETEADADANATGTDAKKPADAATETKDAASADGTSTKETKTAAAAADSKSDDKSEAASKPASEPKEAKADDKAEAA